jgi:hypothetical protein
LTHPQEIAEGNRAVVELQREVASAREAAASTAEERLRLQRAVTAAETALGKAKRTAAASEGREAELKAQLAALQRDVAASARAARSVETSSSALDVRLARALEENERLKAEVAGHKAAAAETERSHRAALGGLQQQVKRLERVREELLSGFKKQLKLIDILKRQRIHVSGAVPREKERAPGRVQVWPHCALAVSPLPRARRPYWRGGEGGCCLSIRELCKSDTPLPLRSCVASADGGCTPVGLHGGGVFEAAGGGTAVVAHAEAAALRRAGCTLSQPGAYPVHILLICAIVKALDLACARATHLSMSDVDCMMFAVEIAESSRALLVRGAIAVCMNAAHKLKLIFSKLQGGIDIGVATPSSKLTDTRR